MTRKGKARFSGLVLSAGVMAYFVAMSLSHIFGEKGIVKIFEIRAEIERINQESGLQGEKNVALEWEIRDIKENLDTLEYVARRDLGMIRKDETFYYFE